MTPERWTRFRTPAVVSLLAACATAACAMAVLRAWPGLPVWAASLAPGIIAGIFSLAAGIARLQQNAPSRVASCQYGNELQCGLVYEHLPAAVWIADQSGKSTSISHSSDRIFEYNADALMAGEFEFFDLVHPDDAKRVVNAFRALFQDGQPYDLEFRARNRLGVYRWVHGRAIGTYELDGKQFTVGLATDITARHEAKQALRNSQQFAQSTIDALQSHICVLDENGTIIAVNKAWRRFAEANQPDAAGGNALCEGANYLAACDNTAGLENSETAEFGAGIRSVLSGARELFAMEFPCHAPSERRWFVGRATRFLLDGSPRVVVEHYNITPRKAAEEAAIAAKQAAEEANQAKSRFLTHMSHEIRTPINGVLGMLELLTMTPLAPQQRRYADVARQSGELLLAIIENVLDLSKIEADKVTLEAVDFDLHSLLHDVRAMLELQAEAKRLALICHISDAVPSRVRGDPSRLRQVLVNLVANAIKFTKHGEVRIEAVPAGRPQGKAPVSFAVSDTGIGMRPDQMAVVFEPFVQADLSTARNYGGTGLGLAISKQLVELMGGELGVTSEEGAGSTFWFTVPFDAAGPSTDERQAVDSARLAAAPPDAPVAINDADLPRARVLLAEDNVTNQAVTAAQLMKLGVTTDVVSTGAEALDALEQREYDLILMDCDMPEMDGYEATKRIRASSKAGLPVVALTADAMRGDRERCLRRGMDDYLPKPVQLQQLADVLRRWVSPGAPKPVANEPSEPAEPDAVFDESGLLGRLLDDRSLAEEIIRGFLDDCPRLLALLCERLEQADTTGGRRQAHKLKGAAASVGAVRLRAVALELEQAAAAGALETARSLLPSVHEEVGRFNAALARTGWPGVATNSESRM